MIQRSFLPYDDSYPWLPFAIEGANRATRKTGARVVFSTSPTLANHLAALAVKARHGVRWIADFRDPLWGNPFRTRGWADGYDMRVEKLIFRHADAVIANTDALANMWLRRHPEWANKISVLWNGYDPEDAISARPIPSRRERVLAHIGNIYQGRTPAPVLSSLERLIGNGKLDPGGVKVQLVGILQKESIAIDQPPFRTLVELGCLEYTGNAIPLESARRAMSESDYLLLLDVNGQSEGLQVPAKLFEYIRIGRPILALTSKDSPVERILSKSGIPHTCVYPTTPPQEMDRSLLAFLEQSSMPVAPSSYFSENFDGVRQTAWLASQFDRLLGESSPAGYVSCTAETCR